MTAVLGEMEAARVQTHAVLVRVNHYSNQSAFLSSPKHLRNAVTYTSSHRTTTSCPFLSMYVSKEKCNIKKSFLLHYGKTRHPVPETACETSAVNVCTHKSSRCERRSLTLRSSLFTAVRVTFSGQNCQPMEVCPASGLQWSQRLPTDKVQSTRAGFGKWWSMSFEGSRALWRG